MIKRFCDACDTEITDNPPTYIFEQKVHRGSAPMVTLKFKIIAAVDGTWNGGLLCTQCIRDGITMGEEVTK